MFFFSAPTTPKSQLIAAARVTFEAAYQTTAKAQATVRDTIRHQPTSLSTVATDSGSAPGTTMSRKTINTGVAAGVGLGVGAQTPRRSTTAAPGRISTTRPPKGRRPYVRPGGSNNRGTSAATSGATNGAGVGGVTSVGTGVSYNNGKINNTNGGRGGSNGNGSSITNGAGGKNGNTNSGNTNSQTGNTGFDDRVGLGNLYPGLAGGPITDEPPGSSHFGICPKEYKYYCLNGGKCTWLTKLEKPSCR